MNVETKSLLISAPGSEAITGWPILMERLTSRE